jgi:transposase
MRIEGVADVTRSPWSCAGSWWARGQKAWRSARYSTPRRHAEYRQGRLAHLTRDRAYAVETSDEPGRFRLKFGMDRAFVLADDLAQLAGTPRARSTIF